MISPKNERPVVRRRSLFFFGRFLFFVFLLLFVGDLKAWQVPAPELTAVSSVESTPPVLPVADESLTLIDCYELALKQSEDIAISQEVIHEAESHFIQALSGILPSVTYERSQKRQNGTNGTSFTLRDIPESKFIFFQPLFSGFKEFAGIAASKAERRQREQEKIRAEQLLFTDVSDAFYLLLSYQEDLEALKAIQSSLNDRLAELNKREELGRSRPSEIASSEVRLLRIEADLEMIQSQSEVSRELLEFLTGRHIDTIKDISLEDETPTLEDYIKHSDARPDVKAANEAWTVAHKNIAIARSGFFPTVGLEGDYYTKRVGASAGVTWDMTLRVDVPIFEGGENIGNTKEANALAKEAELRFNQTRRNAVLEIENAFTRWQSAKKRLDLLGKALEAAERNFKLQSDDYRFNLVNNLDVLQALEDLETSRRDFIGVKSEEKRSYWQLQVAGGVIGKK